MASVTTFSAAFRVRLFDCPVTFRFWGIPQLPWLGTRTSSALCATINTRLREQRLGDQLDGKVRNGDIRHSGSFASAEPSCSTVSAVYSRLERLVIVASKLIAPDADRRNHLLKWSLIFDLSSRASVFLGLLLLANSIPCCCCNFLVHEARCAIVKAVVVLR